MKKFLFWMAVAAVGSTTGLSGQPVPNPQPNPKPKASKVHAIGASADTDTTFSARGASRFVLENTGGDIEISGWDREEIRISAEHSRRANLEISRSNRAIYVEVDRASSVVEYHIWLPNRMDVDVEAYHSSIDVVGINAEVSAETFTGNVRIQGGRGSISAVSVAGQIEIDGAEGAIVAENLGGGVTILNSSGPMEVESTGGNLTFENVSSPEVVAETVGGTVRYQGAFTGNGDYYFASHGGSLVFQLPEDTNATLLLTSVTGGVRLRHPTAVGEIERRGRSTITLGNGGPTVEVETFGGTIRVEGPRRRR